MTINAAPNESQVAYHRRRAEELKQVRQPWEGIWQELADYIEPTRLRLQSRNEAPLARRKIIDSTGTFSLRTLQSGMHSGASSPARPWFRLSTYDPDLKDYAPIKTYLAAVETRMREVFQSSNVYNSFHTGYGDLGQFGQSCGLLVDDDNAVIRLQQLIHGTFWLARDDTGRATTVYRRFRWSVDRIVSRFGIDRVSRSIKEAYDQARYGLTFDVWHAVEPRLSRDPSKIDKANKPFLSNYWLDGGDERDGLLEESGFDENPIIAPPWELAADDHYALSPGQIVLGDIKMLQLMQTRGMEAVDKLVRPPMTGPTSMRNNPASTLPGSITYTDDPTGKGYRTAMEVQLRLAELDARIDATQRRIERGNYADLFLMLANMEGVQPRNTFEIAERKEEKLLALGPVLENVYGGQFEPTIERTFAILNRRGELPPPPPELEEQAGEDAIKVEYISILAQAQKAVATGAIERGAGFIGQLASVKPDVLDKFDADEAIDIYADMVGMPPSIIVPDEEVAKIRDARAQRQQAAENAEMAATVAPAAKAGADAAAVLAGAQNNAGAGSLLQQIGLQ